MDFEDKAREFIGHMQVIKGKIYGVDKNNPAVCDVISAQEANVLLTVGVAGHLTMSDIAERLQVGLSSVTWVVDKLEDKKFVHRLRSDDDRRVVRVELTEEGRQFHKLVEEGYLQMARGILQALNPDEQDVLLDLFRKISGKLKTETIIR
ncbi:MAG: MarR family transcriptional regulator [Nitrospirae bacterium]|nr:MarR family transcriptional regulator [Nitrospirota bacterium]